MDCREEAQEGGWGLAEEAGDREQEPDEVRMGLRAREVWRKEGEARMTKEFQGILEGGKPRVAQLCRDLSVRELRLFGSAATDKFDEARSDVDVVVDFVDGDKPGIADRYLALAEGLEEIFNRPVDLVTTRAIRNPLFRRIVDETGRLIYAA